jgi:hypothetical protein
MLQTFTRRFGKPVCFVLRIGFIKSYYREKISVYSGEFILIHALSIPVSTKNWHFYALATWHKKAGAGAPASFFNLKPSTL